MENLLDRCLDDLEQKQLIEAASPYRLTPLGERVALAGLDPGSCLRLQARVRESLEEIRDLLVLAVNAGRLTGEAAEALVRLVFSAEEVLEKGLWLRRSVSLERQQVHLLRALERGDVDWPTGADLYETDIGLFSAWIMGASLEDIGERAPTFRRGLFSSENRGVRASDAADYLGRLSYPASWAWAAGLAMLGPAGDEFPSWIRKSIEWGVPSQVATELIRKVGLSRRGALMLSDALDVGPDDAVEAAAELSETDLDSLGLTSLDKDRLLESAGPSP
jgi:hypothetical protein